MNASSEIIPPHCVLLASVVSGFGESRYHTKSNAIFNAFKVHTKNLVTFIWRYIQLREYPFFLTFPACFKTPVIFPNLNLNCYNVLDLKKPRISEKSILFQKVFLPLPSTSNFDHQNIFSHRRSEQFWKQNTISSINIKSRSPMLRRKNVILGPLPQLRLI